MLELVPESKILEIIVELEDIHGEARVSDGHSNLAISRPTVVRMLGKMAKEGWIEKNPYRPVKLCQRKTACRMDERKTWHSILISSTSRYR